MKTNTLVTSIRFDGSQFSCLDEHRKIQEWFTYHTAKLNINVVHVNRLGVTYAIDVVNELCRYDVAGKCSGDIILTEPILKVFDFLRQFKEPAFAVSHQRVFKQEEYPDLSKAKIPPYYGIPLFVGNNMFWEAWRKVVHPKLVNWAVPEDNYLLSFGNQYYSKTAFNFTSLCCLYHPEHGGRVENSGKLNEGVIMEDKYCGIPQIDLNTYYYGGD